MISTFLIVSRTCGHPFQDVGNDSVIIEGYKDPAFEGDILSFDCPPLHAVCTKTPNSLTHPEVNHARGSYVYTMGILYRRIPTWRTKQLVNCSRLYLSTKPVRRLLNQELDEVIVF